MASRPIKKLKADIMEHMDVEQAVFKVWCGIGKAKALTSHTQIAAFLIQSFQRGEHEANGSSPGQNCVHCNTPLLLLCTSCDVSQLGKLQKPENQACTSNTNLTHSQNIENSEEVFHNNLYTVPKHEPEGSGKWERGTHCVNLNTKEDKTVMSVGVKIHHERRKEDSCSHSQSQLADSVASQLADSAASQLADNFSAKETEDRFQLKLELEDAEFESTCDQDLNSIEENNDVRAETKGRTEKLVLRMNLQKGESQTGVEIKQHSNNHSYMCGICDTVFTEENQLCMHVQYEHCESELNQSLQFSANTEETVEDKGGENQSSSRPTVEDIVEKNVNASEIRTDGRKMYCCINCGQKFDQRYKMKRHFQIHVNYRPYLCPVCHTRFHQRFHLERHMKRKHFFETTGTVPASDVNGIDREQLEGFYRDELKIGVDDNSPKVVNDSHSFSCKKCKLSFTDKHSLKTHISSHKSDRRYSCYKCTSVFHRLSHLKIHSMWKHQSSRPFVCSLCSASFRDTYHLNRHKMTHTQYQPYKCTDCDKAFSNTRQLKTHLKTHMIDEFETEEQGVDMDKQDTEEDDLLGKSWCGAENSSFQRYIVNDQMTENAASAENAAWKDTENAAVSENKEPWGTKNIFLSEDIETHEENTDCHENNKAQCAKKCPVLPGERNMLVRDSLCSRVEEETIQINNTENMDSLKMKTAKSSADTDLVETETMWKPTKDRQEPVTDVPLKDYAVRSKRKAKIPIKRNQEQCVYSHPECCESSPSKLQDHLSTQSGERTRLSQYRGQGFKRFYAVKRHEVDSRPFVCKECGQAFTRYSHLMRHARQHSVDQQFVCCVCGASFNEPSHLKRHIRRHTGEKPFMCEWCGASFIQSGEMKTHIMAMHTDQRPYQCTHCHKSYTTSSTLKVHMRSHTGERPYVCATCGAGFKIISHLKDHKLKHTGEKPKQCSFCAQAYTRTSHLKRHILKAHPGCNPTSSTHSAGP